MALVVGVGVVVVDFGEQHFDSFLDEDEIFVDKISNCLIPFFD